LKEEHRLKLLENRVLRKQLGRKKDEVNEGLDERAFYGASLSVLLTTYLSDVQIKNS
jgi:hypothetical protein